MNIYSSMAANTKLKSDSPLSRRIVRSFLHFLDHVEPAPGVDLEGLEVVRECLTEVFNLDSPYVDGKTKPDSLIDIFGSVEASDTLEKKSDNAPSSSSAQNIDAKFSDASKSLVEDWTKEPCSTGVSIDELFGQFFASLEKIHYFKTTTDGNDDPSQVDKASRFFHDALNEMERSGPPTYNRKNLAETFKSQGNQAMQSKQYSDAIEFYSFAIALYENNAVYYCNRAAAYTQIHKYAEAIRDCLKSIAIDPNYCKAYSRLGLAYYAQGNYNDAIEKGFIKALQLDPNNESVKENIRMAEQKLIEEMQRMGRDQSTSASHDNQESNPSTRSFGSHGTPPPFTMSFDPNNLPTDIASMLMNMASNIHQGQHSQTGQGQDGNFSSDSDRIGGNINFNFGENMPENVTGTLRSMMEMFSGVSSQRNNPQDSDGSTDGRSATH